MEGNRIVVEGNHAYWVQQAEYSNDFRSFRNYFDMVFAYANTVSLERQLKCVDVKDMQIGDVFMEAPLPGHCAGGCAPQNGSVPGFAWRTLGHRSAADRAIERCHVPDPRSRY